MARTPERSGRIITLLRSVAQRLLTIGGNRIELLAVEAQEERALLLGSILLALVMVAFGLLGGTALTAAVAVLLWERSHAGALLGLGFGYLVVAAAMWWRLAVRLKRWHMFAASIEQLRKDRESLEEVLR
jgi:uncharacterized membrane protein YqjE